MIKLCKDCRWIRQPFPDIPVEYARCGHPSSVWRQGPDLVTGEVRETVLSCQHARARLFLPIPDPCGPDGKHWEPATSAAGDPPGFV